MDEKPHSIAERSADANILISEFSKKTQGDVVTYEQIQQWLGWDVRNNRSLLNGTVSRRLLKDYGMVLAPVFRLGYKVCTDTDIVEGELSKDRNRRRRSAIRSKAKAGVVNLSKLTDVQRLRCLGEVTAAHIVIESSREKSVKQIEAKMNGATTPLALNHALEAIKKNL